MGGWHGVRELHARLVEVLPPPLIGRELVVVRAEWLHGAQGICLGGERGGVGFRQRKEAGRQCLPGVWSTVWCLPFIPVGWWSGGGAGGLQGGPLIWGSRVVLCWVYCTYGVCVRGATRRPPLTVYLPLAPGGVSPVLLGRCLGCRRPLASLTRELRFHPRLRLWGWWRPLLGPGGPGRDLILRTLRVLPSWGGA